MKIRAFKKTFSIFIFACLLISNLFAQGDDPIPPGAEIPIDGGILGLLAAGAVYGAKKIYDKRKQ